jgi:hypothetical protein
LLSRDRWFSPGTPASSTTKTGRHDIAEILLKVGLKHQKSKINIYLTYCSLPVRFFFFYRHEYIAEDNTHLMLNKN